MVINLIKKEFRDSVRLYMPIIAGIIAFTALLTLQFTLVTQFDNMLGILNLLFLPIVVVIFAFSIRASVTMLYTNNYNNKGYELFTLPVEGWEIIVSKVIVLVFWNIVISIVTVVCGIFLFSTVMGSFTQVMDMIGLLLRTIGESFTFETLLFIVDGLLSSLFMILLVLFAGAIANSSYIQKYRGWITIAIVIGVQVILGQFSGLMGESVIFGFESMTAEFPFSVTLDTTVMYISIAVSLVLIGVSFYGTTWFWKNKLELLD